MDTYVLLQDDFNTFIKKIMADNSVFAPIEDNAGSMFSQINSPSEILLNVTNSKIPPKSLLFHQTETLFKFKPGVAGEVKSTNQDNGTSVVFGIRPCDARSFNILDKQPITT